MGSLVMQDFAFVESDHERARVRARRERVGMSIGDLAEAAEVSRDTLSDLELGKKGYRNTTLGKVVATLERIERETGLDELPEDARRIGDPDSDLIEIRVEGNFGVRVVVKGPVRNLDALQETASKAIADMQTKDED